MSPNLQTKLHFEGFCAGPIKYLKFYFHAIDEEKKKQIYHLLLNELYAIMSV